MGVLANRLLLNIDIKNKFMRYNFNEIFKENPDGSLTPIRRIRIGGVELGPGVTFSRGAYFGGVDFTLFRGHRIEVNQEGDVFIVQGIQQ